MRLDEKWRRTVDVVKIANGNELTDAIANGSTVIEIDGTISGIPSLTLPPGVNLRGGTLDFKAKGLRLTSDNEISELRVVTEVHEPAIFNDTSVADLGALSLVNVTTVGQVYLVAEDQVRAGRIVADNVNVECADVRGRFDRPHGFGVDALQGGFTIWNRQPDPAFTITARLTNISSGTNGSPVRGSGVFVGGHGNRDGHDNGGVLKVDLLSTDTIVTDGGIQRGTPDLISGGVFTISGSEVDEVVN